MTADTGTPLSSERVLDELTAMAGVEHALVVEYLTLRCALGHDLPESENGPRSETARDVAQRFNGLAADAMLRIRRIADVLDGVRTVSMHSRPRDITDADGTAILFAAPDLATFLDHAAAVATAVDARYEQLHAAAMSAGPVPSEELLATITDGGGRAEAIAALREQVGDRPQAELLRATSRFGHTEGEKSLVRASDRTYALMIELTQQHLDGLGGDPVPFRLLALGAMDVLDNITRAQVAAGLVPAFPSRRAPRAVTFPS